MRVEHAHLLAVDVRNPHLIAVGREAHPQSGSFRVGNDVTISSDAVEITRITLSPWCRHPYLAAIGRLAMPSERGPVRSLSGCQSRD